MAVPATPRVRSGRRERPLFTLTSYCRLMDEADLDLEATAEALRREEKIDRDKQVAEELDQVERITEALASDDDPA